MNSQAEEYAPDEMLLILRKYFEKSKYEVTIDSEDFYPVRVPFYAKKLINDETDEIVVDFTTFDSISEKEFLPSMTIDGVLIEYAAPVTFYRYYFMHAKTYLAYPDYAIKDDNFSKFVKT